MYNMSTHLYNLIKYSHKIILLSLLKIHSIARLQTLFDDWKSCYYCYNYKKIMNNIYRWKKIL